MMSRRDRSSVLDLIDAWAERTARAEAEKVNGFAAILRAILERPPEPATEYLPTSKMARRLGIGASTLRSICLAGELLEGRHFVLRGDRRMFRWRDVEATIAERSHAPAAFAFVRPPRR